MATSPATTSDADLLLGNMLLAVVAWPWRGLDCRVHELLQGPDGRVSRRQLAVLVSWLLDDLRDWALDSRPPLLQPRYSRILIEACLEPGPRRSFLEPTALAGSSLGGRWEGAQ